MHVFLTTFNIIGEKLVVNNFLCKYFIKQLNQPCLKSLPTRRIQLFYKHSFPEIHEVNLRTLTEAVNKLALSAHLDHSCETR